MIKRRSDFQCVYQKGRSVAGRRMILYVLRDPRVAGKVGFAAGKKLGCAAVRSRTKRLLREAYRCLQHELRGDVGILLIGRAGLAVLAPRAAAKARRRGIAVPDHFAGIVAGEAVDTAALTQIAAQLADGTTEVMLHPGTDSAILVHACRWQHDFEAELAAACAPEVRTALAAEGAAVVNFQALAQ